MNEEETKPSETGLTLVIEGDESYALTTEILEEENFDEALFEEAKKLGAFLLEQDGGYGIAANQVDMDRRVFALRNPKKRDGAPTICINPKITKVYGEKIGYHLFKQAKDRAALQFGEGCLSFPGKATHIKRYERIAVEYVNEEGITIQEKIRGFRAVAFQHELDHLDGIVCINHPDKWSPNWKPR